MTSSAEESNTKIEKIMSSNVISLDITKTAAHAADLMTEKRVGSVIVTKNSKAFGIVTERDLVRRYSSNTLLEYATGQLAILFILDALALQMVQGN